MNDLQSVLRKHGDISKISKESGVSRSTISRIASGEVKNPGYKTVSKITKAIESLGLDFQDSEVSNG